MRYSFGAACAIAGDKQLRFGTLIALALTVRICRPCLHLPLSPVWSCLRQSTTPEWTLGKFDHEWIRDRSYLGPFSFAGSGHGQRRGHPARPRCTVSRINPMAVLFPLGGRRFGDGCFFESGANVLADQWDNLLCHGADRDLRFRQFPRGNGPIATSCTSPVFVGWDSYPPFSLG